MTINIKDKKLIKSNKTVKGVRVLEIFRNENDAFRLFFSDSIKRNLNYFI
jgi:hypothetical protein